MANQYHLDILEQGVPAWNKWRQEHPDIQPNLSGANLFDRAFREADFHGADLHDTDLSRANLSEANLSGATLYRTNLNRADLRKANFGGANLDRATLRETDLSRATLSGAFLYGADLSGAILSRAFLHRTNLDKTNLGGADFSNANVAWTHFANVDLRTVKGLDTVSHIGPSTIGMDTLMLSQGDIPEVFLRKAGLPDTFITYIRSLVGRPIVYHSCFISYSSKDEDFATRLYADLQINGVRCWYAPEDIKIGDRIRDRIDESIHLYDKLLLILSENSMKSEWVEDEVEAALEKEREAREQGEARTVLFPVRLDDMVKTTAQSWAAKLRRQRHIGDFTQWKNHDEYQKSFARLLRDLKAEPLSRL